ncbi:MAG TPA: sigma-70 family RNA polymerase sigma factor [Bacteroidota bacterium]|nr:sigma-70 family RNA polymerase sigma factor [Bacteroidota bacterium]
MTQSQMFEREALPHMEALEKFAFQLCHDAHRSKDLVQETMLKAFRHFDTFRQGSNCRAWLFQICKNSYINAYRRRQREPILMDFEDETLQAGMGTETDTLRSMRVLLSDTTDAEAHSRAMGDEVITALQSLPPVFQTAVILSDIEGHPYDEIAEFMKVPVGTVRSRIHRGRSMLAGMLAGYARELGCKAAA